MRRRRGAQPTGSDAALLAAIHPDLVHAPWRRKGHHKVWARSGVLDGIRVARKSVPRLIGVNGLLSPHRTRPGRSDDHADRIITEAPNLMRGTDPTQILTLQDGKV